MGLVVLSGVGMILLFKSGECGWSHLMRGMSGEGKV